MLIASWGSRTRNQGAQSKYEDFSEELMREQFIAGLTFEALRVKLIVLVITDIFYDIMGFSEVIEPCRDAMSFCSHTCIFFMCKS